MKIVIAGASGLVGTALCPALRRGGHEVFRLVRHEAREADEIAWDPARGDIDRARFAGAQAIINLAGENLASGRWTAARRERLRRSRVDATRTLVAAIRAIEPRPAVLLNASAVGIYGDGGDAVFTETSPIGAGFLPEVCRAWEAEALAAESFGVRVVRLRFGVILAQEGGALAKMLPAFRLGFGGPLGEGRQWMSWISSDDVVAIVRAALDDARFSGPLNVVAPSAVRNAEFTRVLGRVIRRPAFLRAPRFALRLALGTGLADEALLASQRAEPRRLAELGYRFRHPTLEAALRSALETDKL